MTSRPTQITISSAFDGGNIEVSGVSGDSVDLLIRDDPFTSREGTAFKQWFYFRSSGCKDIDCVYTITNAGECSYPDAWVDYNVCASYDRKYWFRVGTSYSGGKLKWSLRTSNDQVYFAYFAPYSQESVLNLLTRCSMSPRAQVRTIGSTLDGRSLDLVEFGTGPLHVWATARQHPGETQGSWWMEGFISRLLDPADGLSTKILQDATVHVVPCMNPDGCFRGHLRTNALGYNLNREWRDTDNYQAPSLERSPEVFHVLREIRATGCDMMMDIHGDETLPHNFLSGSEGVPKWQNGPRLKRLQDGFLVALMQATPDMQNTVKYPINSPNGANLSVGSKYIAETFDCLSFTIEMPFKDTADHPHPVQGWCPERAMNFGAAFVNAVAAMLPHLRDK